MTTEQPLKGFELSAPTPTRPSARANDFELWEKRTILCKWELRRAWHRNGRPTLNQELAGLFSPDDYMFEESPTVSNERWEGKREHQSEDADFQHLIEAMDQSDELDRRKGKRWKFQKIRQIIDEQNLFAYLTHPSLAEGCEDGALIVEAFSCHPRQGVNRVYDIKNSRRLI